MTSPGRGGTEAAGSLDMVGHFGFCTPAELNLITNVLVYGEVLKFRLPAKTKDCICDTRLLSC